MNSVKNKTRLAGKRYRDKLKNDKKEIRLKTKEHKKQIKKIRKTEENYEKYNHPIQKTKKSTKLHEEKQCELNTKRTLIRKQKESDREIKQNERR